MPCCCCEPNGPCCTIGTVGGGCTIEKSCECRADPGKSYTRDPYPSTSNTTVGATNGGLLDVFPRGCCQCLRVRVDWCGVSLTFIGAGASGRTSAKLFDFYATVGGKGPGPHAVVKRLAISDRYASPNNRRSNSNPLYELRPNDPTFCGVLAYIYTGFPWCYEWNGIPDNYDTPGFMAVWDVYANSLGQTSVALNNTGPGADPPAVAKAGGYDAAVAECGITPPTVTVLPFQNPLP